MNDVSQAGLDTETPVNPYSLLEAVNRSSATGNTSWLIFLGLMSYLMVTVAGVSHKDLLLNSDITLPILQVRIELTRFFLFAPILLVLFHMGVIGQLVLLARKALEFADAIRLLETTDRRSHPLRLELDNFFFVQAIAGPERSRIVSAFLHVMSWLTLVILPVLLLLYVQIVFLPYHDATITAFQRLALVADIVLVVLVGVFLMRAETSFFWAFLRTSRHNPGSLAFTALILCTAAFFSLFVATIPSVADRGDRPHLFAAADGSLLGLFHRNLNVADVDLVVDKDVTPNEPTISLRGRDLRFARLDRTDLHQADLTGADLEGASLVGADLRGAWAQCGDLTQLLLTADRRAARCASMRRANLSKARLAEAKMAGVDLRAARLDEADLEGAELAHGLMTAASFANARLARADISGGAALQGANFLLATLQGADLSGAKLQMADFTSAGLQAANLSLAGLEAAVLREADLDGANLQLTRLYGADLSGAKVQGADLAGALVWRTVPPSPDITGLADASQIIVRPPDEDDAQILRAALTGLDDGPTKTRLTEATATLLDPRERNAWANASERQAWQSLAAAGGAADEMYKTRITDYLGRLMCRARFANGAVATGVVRRAMGQGFKGDVGAVYDRLRQPDCPAGAALAPRLMRDLATAAEAGRGS